MSLRLPALVCAASIVFGGAGRTLGQADTATTAAAAPDAAAPQTESLKDSVDNFWHYGKIARYDVAATEAQHILSQNADPLQLLTVFEAVAAQHHDNLDEWLLRWQGVDELSAPTTQLITILAQGHNARRNDPKYIEQNIQLLATNQRGYDLSIDRLRESGELAVPMMIDYLRDPSKTQYHGSIRRALRGLGLSAVNPLLAATEMRDEQTLITIVSALGDIGYDVAVPYLARLIQLDSVPASVKAAASDALHKLRVDDVSKLNASDLFYDLGDRFYYDNAAVRADKRLPVGYVWYWTENNGLTKIDVPQSIFHDVMSKRAAEYSLKLGESRSDALSLWLAADYQDEADLPAGQTDPTLAPGTPSAHYFGTAAGIRYLNEALARANKDRNSPVAMKVITSMQEIGGQANLFGAGDHPLMDSLRFPDRLVQYEAAFALAAALPSQQFSGQEHVIPLLSEALSQTGAASVLVVVQTQDELNGLVDGLRTSGYNVVGGITPEQAVAAAAARPTIDAILISEDIGPTAIARLSLLAGQTSRLDRAVKVIVTKTKASPYSVQAVNDPMLYTTQVALTDTAGLKAAIEGARQHGGLLPLDAATADRYATRAADLLAKIAVNRSPVFDLTVALNLLLTALDDSRPDIVKSDATVLGLVDSPEIQPALLAKASDDKTADDLKIAVYKALATNARNFGNKLTSGQVTTLQNVVATAANVDVRTAAAEARGALNLPADQAKLLIMQQSKTSN
jgi:HEAT repeat protein